MVTLEDFFVGRRWSSPDPYDVAEEEIIAFAAQWDPQPTHIGVGVSEGLTGGLCASGWHTAAITMKLLTQMGFVGPVGAGCALEWPTPTRPGDSLRVELTVISVRGSRTKPDRGVVEVAYDTVNQDGEVRQRATSTLVVARSRSGDRLEQSQ